MSRKEFLRWVAFYQGESDEMEAAADGKKRPAIPTIPADRASDYMQRWIGVGIKHGLVKAAE